jgi:tRNA A64-2'-O-ribosylphosphate transferase
MADDVADVSNVELPLASNMHSDDTTLQPSNDYCTTFWIGSTNLVVGTTKHGMLSISFFSFFNLAC